MKWQYKFLSFIKPKKLPPSDASEDDPAVPSGDHFTLCFNRASTTYQSQEVPPSGMKINAPLHAGVEGTLASSGRVDMALASLALLLNFLCLAKRQITLLKLAPKVYTRGHLLYL